jgi:hypothetical protein
MSEVKKRCKYESIYTGWKCPHEVLRDSGEGFCVFHERSKDKNLEEFNDGLRKIWENRESKVCHFEGFYFPASIFFPKWRVQEGCAF